VSFLDVGQGDAIYIRTPDNKEVLVDGGRDATVLRVLAEQRSFFDRTIDVVVATHPDVDHVGGLIDVLQRYQVEALFLTEKEHDTLAAKAFAEAVASEGATIIYPDANQQFQLGASTTLTVFSPRGDERNWESNNASIVMKISYGDTDILLTGDASTGVEDFLVGVYGQLLESEILKLGHHGSRTSTSELFLDTVKPDIAIVSAGVGNRYNHPHQEVMNQVFSRNITTFHTGIDGTVTFQSDGKNIVKK
jgi:beta-lactamase superfamily II metal-dependent hydrolase